MATKPRSLPTLNELAALIISLKPCIHDDYRASDDPDDDTPALQLTVGWTPCEGWAYQTGDNSYFGAAYHHPHWAVVTITRRCNARALARDIQNELLDDAAYYAVGREEWV